jgi:hypothetical protein
VNGVLDRVASVLERRFLLVAFLPVLILGASVTSVLMFAGGRADLWTARWNSATTSVQLGFVLAMLATVWLMAGFVDSQTRNITQIYEGYYQIPKLKGLTQGGVEWHKARRAAISPVEVTRLPPALVARGQAQPEFAGSAGESGDLGSGRYQEELFVLYSDDEDNVMPTRLGNVLRAAEDYSVSRYGADYLLVWPRLAHLCSERFTRDYEVIRANVDFLLVVATGSALFGLISGVGIVALNGSVLMFVCCVLSAAAISYLAYRTSVQAAIEYGEQMRASMDLYRLELLRAMRFGTPRTQEEELAMWTDFEGMLRRGDKRRSAYVQLPATGGQAPSGTV